MANGFEQDLARDERGRFVPGQSGNPAGKVPGTQNRATLLRAALDGPEGPAVARIVIDKALAGDAVTARFIIGRLEPRPRSPGIELDLPEGNRACDIVAAYDATVRAMASGEITPDEAVQVARVLDGRLRAIDLAARQAEREARHARQAETKPSSSGTHTPKPSPSGRGLGEGVAARSDVDPRVTARRPHPDPPERLSKGPRGEGDAIAGEGVGHMLDPHRRVAAKRPHPGPLPRGEGATRPDRPKLEDGFLRPPRLRAAAPFRGDLLHSTCISRFAPLGPALAPDMPVV